jgi:hypothetical protein
MTIGQLTPESSRRTTMQDENEVMSWLHEQVGMSQEEASIVADYVHITDDLKSPEARILRRRRSRGKDAKIEVLHPRNIVLDWEKLVVEGGPRLAGLPGAALTLAGAAATGGAFPVSAALAALGTLAALFKLSQIPLSDEQAKVVEALYVTHRGEPVVPVAALQKDLRGVLEEKRIEKVVDQLAELSVIELVEHQCIKRQRFISA